MSVGLLLPSKEINGRQMTRFRAQASTFVIIKTCMGRKNKAEGENCNKSSKSKLQFIVSICCNPSSQLEDNVVVCSAERSVTAALCASLTAPLLTVLKHKFRNSQVSEKCHLLNIDALEMLIARCVFIFCFGGEIKMTSTE